MSSRRDELRVRTAEQVLASAPSDLRPVPIVPRMAWAGRVTLFAAREKDGKSTLATAATAAVTSGREFLDGECAVGEALWVGLEEHPHDIAARFNRFDANLARTHLAMDVGGHGSPLDDLPVLVEGIRPSLLVIDTLAALVGKMRKRPDPGSASEWTPIMDHLCGLARDNDLALLILHHGRKTDGHYRDSTAIGAGVDVVLEMRPSGSGSQRQISARARWRVDDFAVRLEGGRYRLEGESLSLDKRIIQHVRKNPGASARAVRDGVQGKATSIDSCVNRLVESQVLEDRGQGRKKAYYITENNATRGQGSGLSAARGESSDTVKNAEPAAGRVPHADSTNGIGTHLTASSAEGNETHTSPAERVPVRNPMGADGTRTTGKGEEWSREDIISLLQDFVWLGDTPPRLRKPVKPEESLRNWARLKECHGLSDDELGETIPLVRASDREGEVDVRLDKPISLRLLLAHPEYVKRARGKWFKRNRDKSQMGRVAEALQQAFGEAA